MTAVESAAVPLTGREFFAKVRPNRRRIRTSLCMNNELLDRWNDLQTELADIIAKDAQSKRLANGGDGVKSAARRRKEKEIADLEAELEETQAWFEMVSMPADEWQQLKDSSPPRAENELDRLHGYNRDAVQDEAVRRCMVDPVFVDCEDPKCGHVDEDRTPLCHTWQSFRIIINPDEWQELRESAAMANGAVTNAPKSQPPSTPRRRLAGGSAQPEPGE